MSRPTIELNTEWCLVVPSLKVSGGIREVMRLGEDIVRQRHSVSMLSMWNSPHAAGSSLTIRIVLDKAPSIARAMFDFFVIFFRFFSCLRRNKRRSVEGPCFVFTHYVTLLLSILVPRSRRFFFVQDFEWRFVPPGLLSSILKKAILCCYRTGKLISANSYLTEGLRDLGLPVHAETAIWADARFKAMSNASREIDYVMVLRKGIHKRLDLYLSFIDLARQHPNRNIAVITTEDEIAIKLKERVAVCLLRPSLEEMRAVYARAKCFVHLSDHEGFGLPPLESMGAGCVPVCRDSGGVRVFIASSPLESYLLPLSIDIEAIFQKCQTLIADEKLLNSLSGVARKVFDDGLAASVTRQENIKKLLELCRSTTVVVRP